MLELNKVHCGDCLKLMADIPDDSVDSIVTDPPYGWSFMGHKWDYDIPAVEVWQEALRVLKPGGHALVACGTRTQHRMAVNLEDAGFEIRDIVAWVYGQGFPKSLDISKSIDKQAGAEREIIGKSPYFCEGRHYDNFGVSGVGITAQRDRSLTAPATSEAQTWQGWGTALKPAMELWTLCRKPLSEKNVAGNVLKWGTGGINIDGCRVETDEDQRRPSSGGENGLGGTSTFKIRERRVEDQVKHTGRFPANFIHDGSDEVVSLFPDVNGPWGKNGNGVKHGSSSIFKMGGVNCQNELRSSESGSASRFFYCAKSSKAERGEGNDHPTVKPLALMRYLCRLITPPQGIILDPFAGSGTTSKAAELEGFNYILIEREPENCDIARRRLKAEDNLFSEISNA